MKCYTAWNTDGNIVRDSASGGIFTALAEEMLKDRKGVVCGVCLDAGSSEAFHIVAESVDELGKMRGSKYQQSQMGDLYGKVEEYLRAGRNVLFSGTPCQVAALKNYLHVKRISADDLLCVEVLCHGVTNSKVVRAYIDSLEKRRGKRVARYQFRTKKLPWYHSGSSMQITYEDGTEELIDNLTDYFYVAYNNNLILRPSCHRCRFTMLEGRAADITIGDFWGAEFYTKDKRRLNEGIGLVLINSQKGERCWKALAERGSVAAEVLDVNKAIPRNGALVKPAVMNPNRQRFFARMGDEDFSELVGSLCADVIKKNRLKKAIGAGNVRRLQIVKKRLLGR